MNNNLFDLLLQNHFIGFDQVLYSSHNSKFPPMNIRRKNDEYRLEFAVAGYSQDDISIEQKQNQITVKGNKSEQEDGWDCLKQGIALRSFEQSFTIPEHMMIEGAEMKNGILTITMFHVVPEEKKPKMIPINGNLLASNPENL